MGAASPVLFEREGELRALEDIMVAAAGGWGGVAVVEGPAGIGKTELLLAAARAAPGLGLRPLVARAAALERDFPFGIARQLVEPPILAASREGRATLLEGPARRAGAVLDLDGAEAGDTEPSAAIHGLFWLVANLAGERPLLLVVDDLHWADDPSVRFLAYLARRLEGLPVAVVTSLRAGEMVDGAVDALTAELAARATRPTGAAAGGLRRSWPARVSAAIRRRLVGPDPEALAGALVVLGDGARPELAAALAGLGAHETAGAAARLAGADLLEPGGVLRFRHPLVRAAVAATVDEAERGRGHARAARLLAARGDSAARVAAHLLASPPGDGDPWAVATLREAARAARRQGVPEHAVAPLRRALAEPAGPDVRPGLLRELGRAELAEMKEDAIEHLGAAHDLERDHGERADLALELGMALYGAGRHAAAADVLSRAVDELGAGEEHRERRLRLEAFLAIAGRYDLAIERAVRGRVHRVAVGLRGETPGERLVLAVAALEDPGPTAEGLARAARLQRGGGRLAFGGERLGGRRQAALSAGFGQLVLVLTERGALSDAQALLVEHGLEGELPEQMVLNPLLHARAALRLAQRRWKEAAADARELGRRHERWGIRRPSPNWRALAAEALRAQGEVTAARARAVLARARPGVGDGQGYRHRPPRPRPHRR
jgi:tetratricopeptide (TPR) repeat protein